MVEYAGRIQKIGASDRAYARSHSSQTNQEQFNDERMD